MAGAAIGGLLFGLVAMGVPLLIAAVMVYTLVVSLTRPRRYRPHPACERCGYAVTGLASLTCPECGTDLRAGGIITPAMEARRRGSTLGAILAWTVLMAGAVFVIANIAFVAVGVSTARSAAATAAATATAPGRSPTGLTTVMSEDLRPNSGAFPLVRYTLSNAPSFDGSAAAITVSLSLPGMGGGTPMFTATLSPAGAGGASGAASSFSWTDPLGRVVGTGSTPTVDDVLAWMRAAGVDSSAPGATAEAPELLGLLTLSAIPAGSAYSGMAFTPGGTTVTTMPATLAPTMFNWAFAIVAMVVVGAVVVWALGIWLIVWRRRRMFRDVTAGTAAGGSRAARAPAPAAP
jgi:hypothetical protein